MAITFVTKLLSYIPMIFLNSEWELKTIQLKRKSIFRTSVISFIAFSCMVWVAYFLCNFREIDIRNVKTEVQITTNELFKDFNSEKETSFNQYIEKAIEIKGTLYQVTYKRDTYSLLLRGEKTEALVLCEMQKDQKQIVKALKIGDQVKVKGILKGFLMDAIVLNCIILEEVNE